MSRIIVCSLDYPRSNATDCEVWCHSKDRHPGHRTAPSEYTEYLEWCEEMSKTHDQSQCPDCGLWVIWTPRMPIFLAALDGGMSREVTVEGGADR